MMGLIIEKLRASKACNTPVEVAGHLWMICAQDRTLTYSNSNSEVHSE